MKVVCNGCGAEYKIDPSKIQGPKAWFKCKNCSEKIIVEKEDIFDETFAEEPTAEEPAFENASPGDDLSSETQDIFSMPGSPPVPEDSTATAIDQPSVLISVKKHRFGLTTKVVLLMLIVSLVPGGIFFALTSKSAHDRIISQTNRNGTMISSQLASQVDEWLDKNIRALKTVADLPSIQTMDIYNQEDVIKALQKEYPWMYLVFTTDINGKNIARSDKNNLKNYAGRQYVKDITDGAKLAWQTLIGKTSKKPALVLAVPITRQGKTIGLLAAAMTRDAISERITRFKLGRTGSGFLVDQTGLTVAHQNNAFVLKQRNMSGHPLVTASQEGKQGRIEFMDINGEPAIGFTSVTALGWVVAIQQSQQEALEPLTQARFSALVLLGLTLTAVLGIAMVAGRTLVKPIKELTQAADQISVGDMDVEIKTQSKDEIGDLAQAVIRLQDSIRISISRLQRPRK